MNTFGFEAIGTYWQIDLEPTHNQSLTHHFFAELHALINAFDKNYSRFKTDSLIYQMYRQPGLYTLPKDAKPLFDFYKQLYQLTQGLFTPLIGNILIEAGYDANYSLKPQQINPLPTWSQALTYNFPQINLKKSVMLDLGAAGKGYLIDLIAHLIKSNHISTFTIDGGGDILHQTSTTNLLKIGLEHPQNPSQIIGVVHLQNQAIASSSGNRRKWRQYHHIFNPDTLNSTTDILTTWVIANSALVADGLATALFLTSPQRLQTKLTFEYLILDKNYQVTKSANFPAQLFYNESTHVPKQT